MEVNGQHQEKEGQETDAYEMTPEAATTLEQGFFNRKRVMMVLCVTFVLVIGGGFLFNTGKSKQRTNTADNGGNAARAPTEFLRNLRDRSPAPAAAAVETPESALPAPDTAITSGLPAVTVEDGTATERSRSPPSAAAPPPAPPASRGGGSGGGSPPPVNTAYASPLVPQSVAGSLFGGQAGHNTAAQNTGGYAEQYPYRAAAQTPSYPAPAPADPAVRNIPSAYSYAGTADPYAQSAPIPSGPAPWFPASWKPPSIPMFLPALPPPSLPVRAGTERQQ